MKFHLNKTKDFYCLEKKKQKKMFKFCIVRINTKKKGRYWKIRYYREKKISTLFRHQTLHLCFGFIGDSLGQWNASENDLELIATPFGLKIKRKS